MFHMSANRDSRFKMRTLNHCYHTVASRLAPRQIVTLPVDIWRQIDALIVVEKRHDAVVTRARNATLRTHEINPLTHAVSIPNSFHPPTHLKVVHQAEQLGRPFVLIFGVVLNAHRSLRLHDAAAQLVERDDRTGVHLRQKPLVVWLLHQTGEIHFRKSHRFLAQLNVSQVLLEEQSAKFVENTHTHTSIMVS